MTTNQPNKRLFSGAAGTLALTARRATTLTVTRAAMLLLVMLLTTMTAWATTTSTINVGGTDYVLFTGFTATGGTDDNYGNMVDGSTSTWFHVFASNAFVEFNTDEPIIPKGYIFNTYMEGYFYPHAWVLKAKANTTDGWTTLSSYSGQTLSSGQEFQYACNNDGNTAYKYFRFEASNTNNNIWLTEIRLYGSSPDVYYTHLTKKDATCTETGIKQDCYLRSDGKYFTDETGTTELAESDVIDPIKPHTGEHHEATDVNIEYWQCSMCSKYFSNEGCTTEITEEETKIYRTITIDGSISGLVTSNVNQALAGATVTLTVSQLIDASTLKVNNGAVELTDIGSNHYTFTVPAADVTVTAETLSTYSFSLPDNMEIVGTSKVADSNGKYISGTVITFAPSLRYSASNVSDGTNTLEPNANGVYTVTIDNANINITATVVGSSTLYLARATSDFTAADGETLVGSTSHTVTIANGANITLNNATITGGIVCEGTATITLDGTNSVSVEQYKKAGIQIGGSGTTLTIRGDGSLTATGGSAAAGIGLGRTWDASVTAGAIVIEGGTVNASGNIGIGIGTVGNSQTASIDGISIKGGTVNASLGKGYIYNGCTATIGYIKIYDTIDMVDASKITETVTYMHGETDVTANKTDYFTIGEDGDRRIITPKDDTDYDITIADDIEHGTITGAATAKYMETVTINATPDFGYHFVRLVVKDADDNDVASTGNTFLMPKSNVTVSAVFEQGTHGTTEFTWMYYGGGGPQDQILETIYDGVTTVNIQQIGQSYNILKYEGYTSYQFRLDNDTYAANIPYVGGTGEFYGVGNATNFNVPYDGETGYYDVTLTDVGNGKWGVSILPTAAQMDVVPEQTYTGSAITPEPLVIAGSLNLIKGTDYVYSYTNNTNVGTATVRATFQGDYASLGYVEKTFTIKPSTIMVNVTGSGTVTIDDKSASNGEAFGVMSEKGASVVLTLAPTDGYAVRSVEYGYTNNSGTTASGLKLPISGTTATLTVPDNLKDGTGVTLTVTFAAALVGGADEAGAVALTDAAVTDLAGGWYKVESDITFDHTLNLLGDTHLTIADGATMTVSTATSRGIDSDYTLNVGGAGALSVTASGSYPIAVRVGSYVQTGATVTASGFIGIRCCDVFDADVTNDLTFSGGQLTVTGTSDGIWADNTITISCTNGSDFIQSSSYEVLSGGTIKVADGKALTDGTNIYSGTLTASAINGKTLRICLVLADNTDNDAIISNLNDETVNVMLADRTLYKDGKWNTLCLPFALSAEQIAAHTDFSGATLMELDKDGKNGFDPTDGTLYLTFKAATAIAAGVPYLMKWDAAGTDFTSPVFSGVTIDATASTTVSDADEGLQEVQMVGSYSPVPVVANDKSILFLGEANTLYYSSIDRDIRSCRAYFSVPYIKQNAGAKARAFRLDFGDGEQTGIMTVQGEGYTVNGADAWYTLDGRKLDGKPATKGLYINGGKKVVIK